jgi:hypothetical protein
VLNVLIVLNLLNLLNLSNTSSRSTRCAARPHAGHVDDPGKQGVPRKGAGELNRSLPDTARSGVSYRKSVTPICPPVSLIFADAGPLPTSAATNS